MGSTVAAPRRPGLRRSIPGTRIDREVFQLSREMVRPSIAMGGRRRRLAASRAVRRMAAVGVCTGGARSTVGRQGASAAAAWTSRGRRHGTAALSTMDWRTPRRSEAGRRRHACAVRGDLCLVRGAQGLWDGEVDEVPGGVQVPVSACCLGMVAAAASAAMHAASSLCTGAGGELLARWTGTGKSNARCRFECP